MDLGKEKIKSKIRRENIVRIRVEINEIETRTIEKIKETDSCFFKKINKIDRPSGRLTKRNLKIRNERGDIIVNTIAYIGSWDYCELLYANKFNNLEEMDKFLETKPPCKTELRRNR